MSPFIKLPKWVANGGERWRRNNFNIRSCTKHQLTFCTVNTAQLLLTETITSECKSMSLISSNTLQYGHKSDKRLVSVHRHLTCIYIGKTNTFLCHTMLPLVTTLILMLFLWKESRVSTNWSVTCSFSVSSQNVCLSKCPHRAATFNSKNCNSVVVVS